MVKNSFASSFCVQLFPYPYNFSFGFSLAQLPAPILSDYRRFEFHIYSCFNKNTYWEKQFPELITATVNFFFLYRRAKTF